MFSSLFGKAKEAPKQEDTIRALQEMVERLKKREAYLEKKIKDELARALENRANKKSKYILYLLWAV